MNSLIKKDLISLKNVFFILIGAFLLLSIASFIFGDLTSFLIAFNFIPIIFILINLMADDSSGFNIQALIMPVSSLEIALSKYLVSFIFFGFVAILNILFFYINKINTGSLDIEVLYNSISISLGIYLYFINISIPYIYRYGEEKFGSIIMLISIGPNIIVNIIEYIIGKFNLNMDLISQTFNLLIPPILMLSTIVSIYITRNIISKRKIGGRI